MIPSPLLIGRGKRLLEDWCCRNFADYVAVQVPAFTRRAAAEQLEKERHWRQLFNYRVNLARFLRMDSAVAFEPGLGIVAAREI
jgi:hypothetical protein